MSDGSGSARDDGGETRSQLARLGLIGRTPSIGKHYAMNDTHLRAVIARLDAAGDVEAADTIVWLLWWRELDANRDEFLRAESMR